MTANLNDECQAWQPATQSAAVAGLADDPVAHRTQKAMKLLLGLLKSMPDSQPPADLVSRTVARVDQDLSARNSA